MYHFFIIYPRYLWPFGCQTLTSNFYYGVAILLKIRSNKPAVKGSLNRWITTDRRWNKSWLLLGRPKFDVEDGTGRREKLVPLRWLAPWFQRPMFQSGLHQSSVFSAFLALASPAAPPMQLGVVAMIVVCCLCRTNRLKINNRILTRSQASLTSEWSTLGVCLSHRVLPWHRRHCFPVFCIYLA